MRICLNSRNLTFAQRAKIEEYFRENFSFASLQPTLVWRDDSSDHVLLGYPCRSSFVLDPHRDFRSIMVRVHECELLTIAGRGCFTKRGPGHDN